MTQQIDFVPIADFKGKKILHRFTKTDRIELKLPFDKSLITRAKDMGLTWRDKDKVWHGPVDVMFAKQFVSIFPEAKIALEKRGLIKEQSINGWVPSPYLMAHQKNGAEIAKLNDRWCYWHQTGVGKGALGIEIWKQKRVKTLVLCPLSIIEGAWLEDIKKFAPEIKAVNLWRARKESKTKVGGVAWNVLVNGCDVAIVNFDTFKIIKDELMTCGFEMLIIDESSFIKNHKAKTTKEVTKFADKMRYVYLLSGTPAPNSEEEFFSQIRLVDPFLFGRNFYLFKNQWFKPLDWSGFKWGLKPELKEEFKRRVASVSDFVEKNKVLDLPDKTFNIRKVYLSDDERKAYVQMAKKMVAEIEEQQIEAANAAVKVMKLREITSGFLLDEKKEVVTFGNTKLKELQALLGEIGERPVLIWIQFQHEARLILETLGSMARVCNSSVNQTKQIENIRDFKDGKYQYLVAHPASIGHGHTLTVCSDAVYYSLSHSYEKQTQSADRIYRKGQKNQCTYYFLLADDSIDEVIYRLLHQKESRLHDVLDCNRIDSEINREVVEHAKKFR